MYRANYALLQVLEHLGPTSDSLGVEWAEFVGDRSTSHEFTVAGSDAVDAYLELQVYDVGDFDHEILLNDEPLAGFDIPPAEGWQYWMDSLAERELTGTNTLRVRRNRSSDDAFAVGNVVVNWREPVE
jgi:hypothetical protein